MPNRLAESLSPYLRQHADNPVDWHEWGEEAFAEARERDVPLFVSIGYAACHWCHVMAHESFEDAVTASYLNAHFVSIKVDREERPDVDAVYMQATQAMTGQGGWPMSVFATSEGVPFYCGTYFPPQPARGMPSFRQVLASVADAWRDQRAEILDAGERVAAQLATIGAPIAIAGGADDDPVFDDAALDEVVRTLRREYDGAAGGFGGAPKFPPSMVLEFLLRHAARTGSPDALQMAEHTLEAMARGGVYDQLGGGFARYSVDRRWVVPHFEKMLYDNALLLRVYLHWWRLTGAPLGARIARETAEFLLRDLRTAEGGFASSLDADTVHDGVAAEGATYVWTPGDLREVLGDEDGDWAAALLQVTDEGTFEHGTSTLQLRADADDADRWASVRQRLADARAQRPQPARDDKVVAAWNALAISALAEAGALLDEPSYVTAAAGAARLLLDLHARDGRLVRVSRDGVTSAAPAVLEDYATLAEALLVLAAVDGDSAWHAAAGSLLDTVLDKFDDGRGGLYDTADDAERLVTRPRDPSDGATPSGAAASAGALVSFAALTGSDRHREAAASLLRGAAHLARRAPRFAGWWLAVAEAVASGPVEVAVVGLPDDPLRDELHRLALLSPSPGLVVAVGDGRPASDRPASDRPASDRPASDRPASDRPASDRPASDAGVPLLAGRQPINGEPAAYVCRQFVCEAPTSDPDTLRTALGVRVS